MRDNDDRSRHGSAPAEEVIIARVGVPVARLVQVHADERVPGRLAGEIRIREDFDAPLPPDMAEGFGLKPK